MVETRLPVRLDLLLAIFSLISCGEGASVHARDVALDADAMRAGARAVAEAGQLIPAPAVVHARRLREGLRGRMDSLTGGFTALLTPAVSGPPPDREETTGPFDLQTAWSLFGYPALALPFDSGGPLPASVQVIGAMRAESRLLQTAAWIERRLPPPAPVHLAAAR